MTGATRRLVPPAGHFFLLGPRGTGKSTWLRATFPDALFLDLLDPAEERALVARPESLRERVAALPKPSVVVLDEVQRAPSVLTVVHALIERKDGHRFVLTGSSARKLRRSGTDLLGGRAVRCTMHPFLACELGARFDLGQALRLGLVPGIVMAPEPQRALQAYVGLYMREEVKAEGLVRNLAAFGRFLEAMSFAQAQPLNLANVARECEVSRASVDGYLEVLEDMLLGHRLPVFTKRAQRHLVGHPKFHWFDAGVYRSVRPAGPLDAPEGIEGHALEGLVAQHLRAWIDYSVSDLGLHYWRTKSGVEVDFVVYGKDGFWAIEVKNGRRVAQSDLRSLLAFGEDYPQAELVLLHRGRERSVRAGVHCLPVDEFLLAMTPGVDLPL